MSDPETPTAEQAAKLNKVMKRMWWNMPLVAGLFFLPQVFALWGYFGAAGWVDRIPALADLGAPLFVAIALATVTRLLLGVALVCAMYFTFERTPTRSKAISRTAGFFYAILLIALQNVTLVLLTPTLFLSYRAARSVLRLLLKKPSWGFASDVTKTWDPVERTRFNLYFLAVFSGFAILNALVALYFTTDVWVIYNFVAFYVLMGLSAISTHFFRSAVLAAGKPA